MHIMIYFILEYIVCFFNRDNMKKSDTTHIQ